MKRRNFIGNLLGAAVAGPVIAKEAVKKPVEKVKYKHITLLCGKNHGLSPYAEACIPKSDGYTYVVTGCSSCIDEWSRRRGP
jgi:hypothetical protein